jgi:Family of unknown function (DUF6526)
MSQKVQSFESHAKLVPMYHGVLTAMLLLTVGGAVGRLISDFSSGRVMELVLALALLMTALWARIFALGVQDRVIRLEEELRMQRLLPDELRSRIPEIGARIRIGLRFAPDEEVPGIVQRILDGELSDQKSVKRAIKEWKPDNMRI